MGLSFRGDLCHGFTLFNEKQTMKKMNFLFHSFHIQISLFSPGHQAAAVHGAEINYIDKVSLSLTQHQFPPPVLVLSLRSE